MRATLSGYSFISLAVLLVVYGFLISEKINKTIVTVLGAMVLVIAQVFKTREETSQEVALGYIGKNLDVLLFIIGMMILVGIVKESGFFESVAIWLARKTQGSAAALLAAMGYLTLVMTMFLSNIPTVLIVMPVVLVLVKEMKLPMFPFVFVVITMANIGGAMTPISDPTTYYQAKTVGLKFFEVVGNSGIIVIVLSMVTIAYSLLVFRKPLREARITAGELTLSPKDAIRDRYVLTRGIPLLAATICFVVLKEPIDHIFGITIDNASIVVFSAFLAMLIFKKEPGNVFRTLVDWEIVFFFIGLFVVVGALTQTHVVTALAKWLLDISGGNNQLLRLLITGGSGVLSMFIDNVPYNITMVGAVQSMAQVGVFVYPLWWGLNLGTSLGGAGSPIGAVCNVIALGQASKEKFSIPFAKYLAVGFPLVIINSLVTFGIIAARY